MFLRRILFLAYFTLIYSCAIQVPPQGGAADHTPPVLNSVTPSDQSTGFSAREIVFEFDENIQLKDLNSQLLISPPLKKQPLAKVRKNRLYLDLDDTLKPNTTYCFNFGGAVADLNEGNAITDFTYVVSTGTVIDTLKLTGYVFRAEDLKPEEGAVVSLYDTFEDAVPYKETPRYYGRTGKDGSFMVRNIAPGMYRLFALRESNGNYLFDDPAERIAFDTVVYRIPAEQKVQLLTFQRERNPVFMKASASVPGRIQAVFTGPVSPDSIHWLTGNAYLGMQPVVAATMNDTLDFWYTRLDADTAAFVVARDDKQDTVQLTLKKKSSSKRTPLTLSLSCGGNGLQAPNKPLSVYSSVPIAAFIPSSLRILSDTLEQHYTAKVSSSDSMQFDMDVKWNEGGSYTVELLPGTFTDIFGNTNDTLIQRFTVRERSDYGTLKIVLAGIPQGGQRILSVMDEKENTVLSSVVTGDTTCFYEFVSPARFRLKLITDANKNGRWDTGDDLLHRQPERVQYYSDPVPVRANWDVEIKWQVKD